VTDAEQPRTLKNSKLTEETARELLLKIESLELQQFYLDPEISQNVMATLLKTNTAYLSDTINTYKGNNFTGYINGLRIGYITQMLRERGIWRHYSVGTLALEAGFKNRVTFSQAFKHHQRMSVRTYIEQLNRERRGAVDW
jgi:AraC-like DNA-binding protein